MVTTLLSEKAFPSDWIAFNLLTGFDIKARIGWQGLTTQEYMEIGQYLLVTGTEFTKGNIDWNNCWHIKKDRYDQDKNIQLLNGDVLITKDGTIGKVAIVKNLPMPATLNSGVFVVRPKTLDLNPEFLFRIFSSNIFEKFLNELSAGSTINHLYQRDIVKFSFRAPSDLREQQAIAEALNDADALIASLEKFIEKKQKIKSALMRHHFFDPKKERNGYLPLGDVAKIYQSETISNSEMSTFGYPVYGANGQIGFFHRYNHEDWQVTVTCRGSTCGTVGRTVEKSWITGNAMVINTDAQESVYKPYLYHYLCSIDFSDLITGTGQPQIVREPLRNTQIMLPDIERQKEIASQLEDLDELQSRLKDQLNKAKKVKAGMMQELLTGRTRLI